MPQEAWSNKRERQYERIKGKCEEAGHTNRPKGRTKEQLYNEAKRRGIEGRSSMSKDQLQKALAVKSK